MTSSMVVTPVYSFWKYELASSSISGLNCTFCPPGTPGSVAPPAPLVAPPVASEACIDAALPPASTRPIVGDRPVAVACARLFASACASASACCGGGATSASES